MKHPNPSTTDILKKNDASPYDIAVCRAGTKGCKNALVDVSGIAENLQDALDKLNVGECIRLNPAAKGLSSSHNGSIPYRMKFKAAVAGCPNSCSQPQIKDFGISGQARPLATENPCTKCMECVGICKEKGAVLITDAMPVFDYSLCVLCGDCAKVCPTEAIIIEKKGLKVMVNGKLGRHPRLAETRGELVPENKLYRFVEEIVAKKIS